MIDMEELCQEVEPLLCKLDAGHAFLYLFRRFGFPNIGSDDHKNVCAYAIPCEVQGTFVILKIGGTRCSIGWTATEELFNRYMEEERLMRHLPENSEFVTQCNWAIRKTLRDLLRPVFVRDVQRWIFGLQYNRELTPAKPFKSAGYGLSEDLFEDPNVLYELIDHIRDMGKGNFAAGARKVLEER